MKNQNGMEGGRERGRATVRNNTAKVVQHSKGIGEYVCELCTDVRGGGSARPLKVQGRAANRIGICSSRTSPHEQQPPAEEQANKDQDGAHDDDDNERFAHRGVERRQRRTSPVDSAEAHKTASAQRHALPRRRRSSSTHLLSFVPAARTLASHPLMTARYRFPNTQIQKFTSG